MRQAVLLDRMHEEEQFPSSYADPDGLEQAIEASQADENAHDQPTSVEII
jgi:hypothetical protein